MKKLLLILGLVFPLNVNAECAPMPSCAEIGYTATSCDGQFLRCPFDTNMLLCVPCDSMYKYTCDGENMTGGAGQSCNGKYASCECVDGKTFKDGTCS